MHSAFIFDWLQTLEHDASPNPTKKRDRAHSDADSAIATTLTSPPKRARPSTPDSLPVRSGDPSKGQHATGAAIAGLADQDETPTRLSYRSVAGGSGGVSAAAAASALRPREILIPQGPSSPARGWSMSPERHKVKNVPDLAQMLAVPLRYTWQLGEPGFFSASGRQENQQHRGRGEGLSSSGGRAAVTATGPESLQRRLFKVAHSQEILPSEMRNHIEALVDADFLLPSMWTQSRPQQQAQQSQPRARAQAVPRAHALSNTPSVPPLEALVELGAVQKIVSATWASLDGRNSEAGWNCAVHQKVLDLALEPFPTVEICNVTRAPMAAPFRPRLAPGFFTGAGSEAASLASDIAGGSDAVSSARSGDDSATGSQPGAAGGGSFHKMVDFALQLKPDGPWQQRQQRRRPGWYVAGAFSGSRVKANEGDGGGEGAAPPALTSLVQRYLSQQAIEERWINAMAFQMMRERPAPVYIETKSASGKLEDAKVQLGICLAGWHARMRRMLAQAGRVEKVRSGGKGVAEDEEDSGDGSQAHNHPVVTVPAILVHEAEWEVVFAVDARGLADASDEIVSGANFYLSAVLQVYFWPQVCTDQVSSRQHIVGPALKLGSTSSVVGTYQLLAGLRCIADWMDTEFRDWLTQLLQDILHYPPPAPGLRVPRRNSNDPFA